MRSLVLVLLLAVTSAVAAAQDASVVIESPLRADDLRLAVRLDTQVEVASVQHDLLLDGGGPIAARADGRPDCRGDARHAPSAAFAFQPPGCVAGDSCTGLRALVISLAPVEPIPSGTVLYTCRLSSDAPARYALGCLGAQAADPHGAPLDVACADAEVEVLASTVLRAGAERAAAGESAAVGVALFSNEATTAVAVDLELAPLLARGASRPACAAHDAAVAATFTYLPAGCEPGTTCTGVRAALSAPAPLAHGEGLFTCAVDLPSDTPPGDYAVALANAGGTTAGGQAASVTAIDGRLRVTGPPRTPTAAPATPTPGGSAIEVGVARGAAGDTVALPVRLRTDQAVAGVQHDLQFALRAPIVAAADGQPVCTAGPEVDWLIASFSYQPPACVPGVDCNGLRAVLLTADTGETIADGTVLYTCAIAIDATAAGVISLPCAAQEGSTPDGHALPLGCTAGRVEVLAPSPTPTATPEAEPDTQGGASNSGCATAAPAPAAAWLLAPLPWWAWRARRTNRFAREGV